MQKSASGLSAFIGSISIFAKTATLIALSSIVVTAVILALQSQYARTMAQESLRGFALEVSRQNAAMLGGAIRFRKIEDISKVIDTWEEGAGDRGVSASVYSLDGEAIYQSNPGRSHAELSRTALIDAAPVWSEDGLSIALPVQFGADNATVGALVTTWSLAPVLKRINQNLIIGFGLSSLVLLCMMLLSVHILKRAVTNPLKQVGRSLREVSGGTLDGTLPHLERGDEIGDLSRDIAQLRAHLSKAHSADAEREATRQAQSHVVATVSSALADLASGDLSGRINTPFPEEYETLRNNVNQTIDALSDVLSRVTDVSVQIRQGLNSLSQDTDNLSNRTESQAATLEQTAAALEELTQSVRESARGARDVAQEVDEARQEAEQSGRVVHDTSQAMGQIEASSAQIAQIIGVIEDIAFQTNLLALNAGVEAARAGEAGRGFAVVASEVRALAKRSSEAAKEIKSLISASTQHVAEGAALVSEASEALTSIVGRVGSIATRIADMANAVEEQSSGIGEINSGVAHLDQMTQQNAAMVGQGSVETSNLLENADGLRTLITRFQLQSSDLTMDQGIPARVA